MVSTEVPHSRPAPDLAKILGQRGLITLIELMCEAYFDLLGSDFVKHNTPENDITEEWYVKIILKYRKIPDLAVVPIHQKEDPTTGKKGKLSPTIDFCFRDQFFSQSYFGAECKVMDEGNSRHITEYVNENGIGRFLDGRYASNCSAGAMIGYVRVGNPVTVANGVASRILTLPGRPKMLKAEPVKAFQDIYDSLHERFRGISPFKIFHLFFAFSTENSVEEATILSA